MKTKYFLLLFVLPVFFYSCKKSTEQKQQQNIHLTDFSQYPLEKLDKVLKKTPSHSFVYLNGCIDKPFEKTIAYLFTYQGNLGVKTICYDSDMDHLVYQNVGRDSDIWKDDNIEIYIDSDQKSKSDNLNIAINPIGTFADSSGSKGDSYDSSCTLTSKRYQDRWEVLCLIPLQEIFITEPNIPQLWINIARTRYGRNNSFNEDTGLVSTDSLRANIPEKFKPITIAASAIEKSYQVAQRSLCENSYKSNTIPFLESKYQNKAMLVQEAKTEINIDGDVSDKEWIFHKPIFLENVDKRNNPNLQETHVKICQKEETLYIKAICYDNQMKWLKSQSESTKNIWRDDTIEVFLSPKRKGNNEYLHLIINPHNLVIAEIGKGKKKDQINDVKKHVQTATSIGDNSWQAEIKINLKNLIRPEELQALWGFNLTRYRPSKPGSPEQNSCWSNLQALEYHLPEKFGSLWLKNAPLAPCYLQEEMDKVVANIKTTKPLVPTTKLNHSFDFLSEYLPSDKLKNIIFTELLNVQEKQFEIRNQKWNQLFKGPSFPEFQKNMRLQFWQSLSAPKKNTPLNSKLELIHENEIYRIFNVLYESEPKHYVTANFYLPKCKPLEKLPTVIRIIGHSSPGKRGRSVVEFCDHLAKHGYAVFCIDSLGQGERIYVNNGNGSRTPTSNHYAMGAPLFLLGENIAQYFVWDVIRAIDLLQIHPNVDATKIVLTGSSGGGTVTSYVAALDQRIAGAASVSAMSSEVNKTGGHDSEQMLSHNIIRSNDSMGRTAMISPRPYIILGEYGSEETLQNNYAMIDQAKMAYRFYNKEENLQYHPTKEPHGYGYGHRKIFYQWLKKEFPSKTPLPLEESKNIFSNYDQLNITKSWKVYYTPELKDRKTVLDLAKEKIQKLENKRKIKVTSEDLMSFLGITQTEFNQSYKSELSNSIIFENIHFHSFYIKVNDDLTLPYIKISSKKPIKRTLVWLNQRGKDRTIKENLHLIKALIDKNYQIIFPDFRGSGELALDDHIHHHSHEIDATMFGIRANQSYFGLKLKDILTIINSLPEKLPIDIIGQNSAEINPNNIRQDRLLADYGLETLHAAETIGPLLAQMTAYCSPKIENCFTHRSLSSYASIADDFYFYQPFSIFIDGILTQTDLNHLIQFDDKKYFQNQMVTGKNQNIELFINEKRKYDRLKNVTLTNMTFEEFILNHL